MCIAVMTVNPQDTPFHYSVKPWDDTMWHEILRSKNFREYLIKRQRGVIPVHLSRNLISGLLVVEIVCESHTISRCNRQYLVFAITIESGPLNLF